MKSLYLFVSLNCFGSYSQEIRQLGVKFTVRDSLIVVENLDKKYKSIVITERDSGVLGEIELVSKYHIEGDVVQDHKLYTDDGEIFVDITSDKQKKKFKILRVKK